jgi:guanidinoacetate N-methyltransferase
MTELSNTNQLNSEYLSKLKYAKELLKIGLPNKPDDWKYAPAVFAEGKLSICGHPVMEDWEAPYMEELAKISTTNKGVVLEVGFGLGLSASYIQCQPIDRHIIIEANAEVFQKLEEFAQNANSEVEPLFGLWQEVINLIPDESLDGILFDAYPLSNQELYLASVYPFFEQAYRLLKKGGVFTYFSNEEEDFSSDHFGRLQAVGFKNIRKKVFPVNTPENCLYWSSNTIVAPIVTK